MDLTSRQGDTLWVPAGHPRGHVRLESLASTALKVRDDQPRGSVFPVPAESQTASKTAPEIESVPRTGNRAFCATRFGAPAIP